MIHCHLIFFFYARRVYLHCYIGAQRKTINRVAAFANDPRISHLFFADDSLVFGRATMNEAREIQRILKVYEASSG